MCHVSVKTPSSVKGTNLNYVHTERQVGDPSAAAGAYPMASLSSLRQDASHISSTAQNSSNPYQAPELSSSPIVHRDELDSLEGNSATNVDSLCAADIVASSN